MDTNHKISFPEHGHDVDLVDAIKRCLVRDPTKRASAEELLKYAYLHLIMLLITCSSHPYLKTESSNKAATPNVSLALDAALLAKLQDAMTPNTRRGLSRAMQKLSMSDTDLTAFQTLDIA